MKRPIKIISGIIATSMLLFGFQNCGESLDLGALQQASTPNAPGVSFALSIAQDPIQNSNFELALSIQNIENYTVAWEKDGVLLANEVNESLVFAPIALTDAGDYEAVVTDADSNEYRTGIRSLVVLPDPSQQTFVSPSFSFNNQNHSMVNLAQVTLPAVAADTFCKAKLGAQATRVSHELDAVGTTTFYYAYATAAAQCDMNSLRLTYQNGFCLAYYQPGFSLIRFKNIVCDPNIAIQ